MQIYLALLEIIFLPGDIRVISEFGNKHRRVCELNPDYFKRRNKIIISDYFTLFFLDIGTIDVAL